MFEIGFAGSKGISVSGRLDAANAVKAQRFLDMVEGDCILGLPELDSISSAGLGVLLMSLLFRYWIGIFRTI